MSGQARHKSTSGNGRSQRIRALNDVLRRTGDGGQIMVTAALIALGAEFVRRAVACMQTFDAFTDDNDPYQEHDFGAFDLSGERVFFKIAYYDLSLEFGSEDPSDPAACRRVLTVMLASDY
jgi:hypothetical protein